MTTSGVVVLGNHPDLAGRTAVVTGGSRGIGAATAIALARNGVDVAVVGRDQAALDGVAAAITDTGGRALAAVADCTSATDLDRLHAQVLARFGKVDIVIAFAGGYGQPVPSVKETPDHWRHVVDSDLTATFLTISAFLPELTAHGGAVVTMASSAGRQASRAAAAYSAAKAGVVGMTRHLANELAPQGVRVNCVAPAAVENDRMRSFMSEEQREQLGRGYPLGRLGTPDDIAAATLFLVSAASSWITGITLDIAGGSVMP
ncbi:SDR family NAD(P)-dependent oxidoreductase [Nocardia sp. NPDC056000]|uniref:SDR family NAD(P)-dependent oxidoreductase n=1 Tax=Nocardia sp. NPDC056000 TaxID=3345674 RepID=UPI0035E3781C